MIEVAFESFLIFALILFNGMLSMSEIALVSARKIRLQQRAEQGDEKARLALDLARNPSRFLSTIQVGITLVGTLSGAYGGATLAGVLAKSLAQVPQLAPYSSALALGIVVLLITYLSLVLGELAPKRLGLSNPERVAAVVAGPMRTLSAITKPVVHLLNASTDFVLRLFQIHPQDEPSITEEEIKLLIKEGTHIGILEKSESQMVTAIFRLGDRRAEALMTPRTEIEWLDLDDDLRDNLSKIIQSSHNHFPVARGSLDQIRGILAAKDLLVCEQSQPAKDLIQFVSPPVFVPENMPAMDVLDTLRKDPKPAVVMVIDEYGGLQGLITAQDILGAIVGEIPSGEQGTEPGIFRREDGSWLVDGRLPIDEFGETFPMIKFPDEERGYYQTLGGFIMSSLGRMPQTGDSFEFRGMRFEVADMDAMRVDKVLITPIILPLDAANELAE